jgi:tRNA (mo5U34)-methyltransferase
MMSDWTKLFQELADEGLTKWAAQLRQSASLALDIARNGHVPKWQEAINRLPRLTAYEVQLDIDAVTMRGAVTADQRDAVREILSVFHPWRKGPFDLFGIQLDAEWRSDLKWARIAPHIDLKDKDVLDVGCGNGYYGWRMLGAGARRVIGLEPYLLYVMQHALIKSFIPKLSNHVIPASDKQLGSGPRTFDVVFSLGVLYHSKNPIGHLESLRHALRPGGQLVLETLVVDGDHNTVLVPEERYAKMRNVWFIPSEAMLMRWLLRAGFRHATIVDNTITTADEQRSTAWMTFESLSDFLDPHDSSRTVEGHPAPRRAIAIAEIPA